MSTESEELCQLSDGSVMTREELRAKIQAGLAAWKSEIDSSFSQCVTRLPEEPSCPSCERTREIIAARFNQSVTNDKPEVADALREILETLSAGRTSTTRCGFL